MSESLNPLLTDPIPLQSYIDATKKLLRQPAFAKNWQEQKSEYQSRMRIIAQNKQMVEEQQDKRLQTYIYDENNNQGPKTNINVPLDQDQFNFLPEQNDQKIEIQAVTPKALHLGVEFDDVIQDENDLIQFLIKNQYYIKEMYLTEDQLAEFNEIFKNVDQLDSRNIGSIVGMAMLGVLGFIALGFSVIGIVAGSILVCNVIMKCIGCNHGKVCGKKNKTISLEKVEQTIPL